MPPKRVLVEKQGRRAAAPKGYIASTYDTLTSPENASVVRSIAVFGVSCFSDDRVCTLSRYRYVFILHSVRRELC